MAAAADGDAPGRLRGPRGVAVGADGRLYIADTGNHRIAILKPSGPSPWPATKRLIDQTTFRQYAVRMLGQGVFRRLVTRRAPRVLALLGAYLLAVQSLGVPRLFAELPSSCCCAHRSADAKCQCKACTHEREVESGLPLVKSCGTAGPAAVAQALDPFHPPRARPAPSPRPEAIPATVPPIPISEPDPEVATPPPLARA